MPLHWLLSVAKCGNTSKLIVKNCIITLCCFLGAGPLSCSKLKRVCLKLGIIPFSVLVLAQCRVSSSIQRVSGCRRVSSRYIAHNKLGPAPHKCPLYHKTFCFSIHTNSDSQFTAVKYIPTSTILFQPKWTVGHWAIILACKYACSVLKFRKTLTNFTMNSVQQKMEEDWE